MEQPPVKRLNRELKYQGTILKIYEDTVEANGHEAHWDFIHHNGAAAVVPVTKEGKLLMVRQYRNALDRYTLESPAGALDFPEEPKLDCAHRELEEEAIDIFVARELEPSRQHLDDDECIDVEEWTVADLEKLIFEGKITDGKTIAAIMAYARKYHVE